MSISPVAVTTTAGLPAIEWIDTRTGQVVVPPPALTSPAATTPTAYVATPAFVTAPVAHNASMLDAIVDALIGEPVPAAGAQAAAGAQQVAPPVAAAVALLAPAAPAAPVEPAVAPAAVVPAAPAPVAAPLVASAPPVATTVVDPTTTNLTPAAAIAGYNAGTGRAAAGAGVAAGVSHAKRSGTELWAGVINPRNAHVTQVTSKYNPSPAANNKDCGPTSVVMTLKLLGLPVPGTSARTAPQKLINAVRELGGSHDSTESTTNLQLEKALNTAGAATSEVTDFDSIKASVLAGKPVILNGNPGVAGAYGTRFGADKMVQYNGAHWIVVSGYDEKTGQFIINDPLSKAGAVKVSPAELEAYRGGSLGISVAA